MLELYNFNAAMARWDLCSEAKILVEDWRKKYNEFRPHSTLKGLTPKVFADQFKQRGTQNLNLTMVH